MKDAIFVIYPKPEWVPLDTIERWYWEAVAANEVAPGLRDQMEMAEALADMGFIHIAIKPVLEGD